MIILNITTSYPYLNVVKSAVCGHQVHGLAKEREVNVVALHDDGLRKLHFVWKLEQINRTL
ncbi:hypothetical protein DPMN_174827 [Dreissena polymorpha]|uniref:Uncharacterized protein n=1 Tax=Dreissena polymorpha TaxID=45954 RepID=A0A9D4IGQ3_DREPO|nr:hypothetical protein DPMN_174827 [Dreissena polymorpha]